MMKPDVEERMKIQRVPWLPADTMEFRDVFIPLQISREVRMPSMVKREHLENYAEMFDNKILNEHDTKRRKVNRRKVLVKGGPGIGKSTLASKIAYDWATSTWNTFALIFFISMKVVNPGDPVSNIIIDPNITPVLYDEEYDVSKISKILKDHGEKCLLIIEGFDEGKTNKALLDVIKDKKYRSCNVLVTARPHAIDEIEHHFPDIYILEGFGKEQAERYVKSLICDNEKVDAVITFTKENESIGIYEMWRYPILLLFICVLVNDGELDLNDRDVTLGDIYGRFHACLYRRYTTKQKVEHDEKQRQTILLKLGKLALEGLSKGKLLFTRKEIEYRVDPEVFHYGIIIGYRDRRIVANLDADFLVCFLHQSVQEYLAALYISEELSLGYRRIEDLWPHVWDTDTVTKLPLLLTFVVDLTMESFVTRDKLLDSCQQALNKNNITFSGNAVGKSTLHFLSEALATCSKTQSVTFTDCKMHDDSDTFLAFVNTMSHSIKKLVFQECIFLEKVATSKKERSVASKHPIPHPPITIENVRGGIPSKSLTLLIENQQGIHELIMDLSHIAASKEKQLVQSFYSQFLKLFTKPLRGLQSLTVKADVSSPEMKDMHDKILKNLCIVLLDSYQQSDMVKYSGFLPDLNSFMIRWEYIPDTFLDILMASMTGRKKLHTIGITGGKCFGLPCIDLAHLLLGNPSPGLKRFAWKLYKEDHKPSIDMKKSHDEICKKQFCIPSNDIMKKSVQNLEFINLTNNYLISPLEMQCLLKAIAGSKTLKRLHITNLWTPHFMPILTGEGLPALETLYFQNLFDGKVNMVGEYDPKGVCTLPRLKELKFEYNYHPGHTGNLERSSVQPDYLSDWARMPPFLLQQLLTSVRGSFYLHSLDISYQNAAACLHCLLDPEGLPVLENFKADRCALLPVDLFRLGRAAKHHTLKKLKTISISGNTKLKDFLCFLCIGTWPSLEEINLDKIELTGWDVACLVCSAGKTMSDLQKIIIDSNSGDLFEKHRLELRKKSIQIKIGQQPLVQCLTMGSDSLNNIGLSHIARFLDKFEEAIEKAIKDGLLPK